MKRITIIALALALTLCAGCATKIVTSQEELPTAKYESVFLAAHDVDEPTGAVSIVQEIEARQAEQAEAEVADSGENYDEGEWYDEGYYEEYYEPTYYGGDSSDGFMQEGVRAGVDSDTETWYSSQVAYHEDTAQWSVDDEGYYRTDDGYYVIASDDYEKGTVINTSKGEARVLDSGTDSGNVDFYVNW